jgi:N-acetylmuramoyl-L-alanine amidase
MSTNPTNTKLRRLHEGTASGASSWSQPGRDVTYAPGREALQALLAFSALHEQIRRRRSHQLRASLTPGIKETWQPERFVLDEVLHLVSERALAITGADGVAIALAEGSEILCRASAGTLAPPVGAQLNPDSGFSGACFRTGLIVRCDDALKDPRVDPEVCRRMGLRSMVAVPLMTEHGVIGLLASFCSEAFGFNDSDVRSLSLLAELILAALQPEEEFHEAPEPNSEPASNPVPMAALVPPVAEVAAADPIEPQAFQLTNVDTVRDALARVTEESQQAIPEPLEDQGVFAQYEAPSASPLGRVAAILLVLAALGGGGLAWWRLEHKTPTVAHSSASNSTIEAKEPSSLQPPTSSAPTSSSSSSSPEAPSDDSAPVAGNGLVLPQLTGIRHWSSADSSTVAIDLQEQVQYEAHRLTDPERIYFDLHGTTVAPALPGIIDVGDPLLVRIRVAQPTPGVTRVVLETKDSPNFSVSLESNPYRLVVEVRSISAKTQARKKIDLFGFKDQFAAKHNPLTEPKRQVQAAQGVAPGSTPLRAAVPKFRIVLDAGHGGWDMGTVGRQGLLEKDLVLDIVARVGNLIESRLGAEVIYTRHDDTYVSLEKRTEVANLAQADMFLSVHANYSDLPSARGVETYYTNTFSSEHARTRGPGEAEEMNVNWNNVDIRGKAQDSRRFAIDVQKELHRQLAAHNPGLRNRGVKQASYVVLTGTTMPAVLAEVSFVSSPRDETSLHRSTYRQQIAEALYKGVAEYAASLHRMNLASASPAPAGR